MIALSYSKSVFSVWRNCHIMFEVVVSFHFLTSNMRVPIPLHPFQNFVFWILPILIGVWWYLITVLVWNFLMTVILSIFFLKKQSVKHVFIYFWL